MRLWKYRCVNVENFVETVENLFSPIYRDQHNHYNGYILKMQERYPDKVSVYYNDVKLTLDEMKKIAGEDL